MNTLRRYLLINGFISLSLAVLPSSLFALTKNEKNTNSIKKLLTKEFDLNNVYESKDVSLILGTKDKRLSTNGEDIYLAQNPSVLPFTINTGDLKTNLVILIIQNPDTLNNEIVAKYSLND